MKQNFRFPCQGAHSALEKRCPRPQLICRLPKHPACCGIKTNSAPLIRQFNHHNIDHPLIHTISIVTHAHLNCCGPMSVLTDDASDPTRPNRLSCVIHKHALSFLSHAPPIRPSIHSLHQHILSKNKNRDSTEMHNMGRQGVLTQT